jgi:hypothetical protein
VPGLRRRAFDKQVTAAGFQLKGSGWYATDFKGGSKPPAADKRPTPAADAKAAKPTRRCQAGRHAAAKPDTAAATRSRTRRALRPAARH